LGGGVERGQVNLDDPAVTLALMEEEKDDLVEYLKSF
jgi:hypothetical protein